MELSSSLALDNSYKAWLTLLERLLRVQQRLLEVDGVADDKYAIDKVSVSIPVPQVAVFGDQSSGKSSLLESISGIPFPKGSGLVTKCPTMISMRSVLAGEKWSAYVTLQRGWESDRQEDDLSKPVFTTTDLADRLAAAASIISSRSGSLNGFSKEYIHVTVSSPQLPDLTVIDLPGIIRTTTSGQDKSVIREVDNLLEEYLRQPETIILAIIPANQDISTIDILERASKFDPRGSRTIGVLTKPDLIDRGTEEDVVQIVQNIRKPLALGYVMVKNRSQFELNRLQAKERGDSSDPTLTASAAAAASEEEEAYFSSHEVWSRRVDAHSRGRKALCRRLTSLIVSRAVDNSPAIKSSIQHATTLIDGGLAALGPSPPVSSGSSSFALEKEQRQWLMRIIDRFTQTLRQVAAGDYSRDILAREPSMRLKFRISAILSQLRDDIGRKMPDFDSEAYAEKLAKNVAEMRGRELPGFGSSRLLLSTVSTELLQWREAVEEALLQMGDIFLDCAQFLATKITAGCSQLCVELVNSVQGSVQLQQQAIQRRLDDIFSRGLESAAADRELVSSIDNLRQQRFETALREALIVAKESDPVGGGGGVMVSAQSKQSLKLHILDIVGHVYMHHHSLVAGPHYKIEDARVAIKSYWRLSESRLHEDIASLVDLQLLTRCGEAVEADLLGKAQQWINAAPFEAGAAAGSGLTLQELLSEDAPLVAKRKALLLARDECQAAMKELQSKLDRR